MKVTYIKVIYKQPGIISFTSLCHAVYSVVYDMHIYIYEKRYYFSMIMDNYRGLVYKICKKPPHLEIFRIDVRYI